MSKVATEADYIKFKKFLRFFVRQAEKNANYRDAKDPIINRKQNEENDPDFWRYYGLDSDLNQIAGVDFTIRFSDHSGSEFTTYINAKLSVLNIIGEFDENKKIITGLRNTIRISTPNKVFIKKGPLREECEGWNKILKSHQYSTEDLGINNDNNELPNPLLKMMLNEYLGIYNNFSERL